MTASNPDTPRVAVVILNYNTWEDTIECLESVLRSDYPDYYVIVVDNGSVNDSVNQITRYLSGEHDYVFQCPESLRHYVYPPVPKPVEIAALSKEDSGLKEKGVADVHHEVNRSVTLITSKENRGFSAGYNTGLRFAVKDKKTEYIWLLNNDAVVDSGALRAQVSWMENDRLKGEKTGILGSKINFYYAPGIIQYAGGSRYNPRWAKAVPIGQFERDNGQYDTEIPDHELGLIIGASMFITRDFLLDVGYLCEDYFLYWEELDWAERARRKGWKLGYCWQSKVYHKQGKSTGKVLLKGVRSKISEYYGTRNRFITARRFYPEMEKYYRWAIIPVILKRLLKLEFGSIRHVWRGYRDSWKSFG